MNSLYVSAKPSFSDSIAAWAFSIISAATSVVTVYFTKRTNGETRRMVCYWSPTLITKRSWDPTAKQLLNVFDVEAGDYRFISMDAVQKIVVNGVTFTPPQETVNLCDEKIQKVLDNRDWVNSLMGF